MKAVLSSMMFASLLSIAPAMAEDVRFASWNVANFTELAGVELRPDIGTKRYAADFDTLKRYATVLKADVISLQEIGTPAAAELLFPTPDFTVYASKQMTDNLAAGIVDDIYTAIAVRNRPDIVVVEQGDIAGLAVTDTGDGHVLRTGTALQLEIAGQPLWVVSVHLKSSCSSTKNLAGSTTTDCETFWSQRIPLRAWIAAREDAGEPFAIMGDFNRQFRRYGETDQFWLAMSSDGVSQPALVAHPTSITRECPTRLGTSNQPIDWIMLSPDIAEKFVDQSYFETRYAKADVDAHGGPARSRLSDHCPIQVDLAF